MNGQKRIRAIVLAGEKLAQLEFFQLVKQPIVFTANLLLCVSTSDRVAFFRSQLLQCAEIFDLAFQFLERIDQRAESRNFLDIGLSALSIRPEIGRGHAPFDYR